jgi:hypothetical protein
MHSQRIIVWPSEDQQTPGLVWEGGSRLLSLVALLGFYSSLSGDIPLPRNFLSNPQFL